MNTNVTVIFEGKIKVTNKNFSNDSTCLALGSAVFVFQNLLRYVNLIAGRIVIHLTAAVGQVIPFDDG